MSAEKKKMIAGEMYWASDPVLETERNNARVLLKEFNAELDVAKRRELLLRLMPNCTGGLYIEPPFFVDYGYNVHAAGKVYFNANCLILDSAPVNIGANTLIAPNVQIYTATHPLDAVERRGREYAKPVTIGEDCWIGGGSIICPGVTIGDRCVVAAGSVVAKDIPPDSLVAGNPAVVKRKIDSQ